MGVLRIPIHTRILAKCKSPNYIGAGNQNFTLMDMFCIYYTGGFGCFQFMY